MWLLDASIASPTASVLEVNVSAITLVPYTSLEETGLKDLRSIGSLGLRKQDAEMFC